jgi:hypothetical protein
MKAVVVEVSGKTAVALKKDGTFVKTARACSIGDIIEITEPQRFFMVSRKFAAIAAALLACIIAGGVFSYQTVFAASYISLDVNPSLEYALNRQNRVIEVKALNSDAEPIAEQLLQEGIRNDTIAEAVSETMEILYKENYLGTGEESVLIAVSSDSAKNGRSAETDCLGYGGCGRRRQGRRDKPADPYYAGICQKYSKRSGYVGRRISDGTAGIGECRRRQLRCGKRRHREQRRNRHDGFHAGR